jgi:nucleotide-binding universal stress UspA family protein
MTASARYVVGVDGSAPSEAALAWAVRNARRDGAPLELAHVVDPEQGMMGVDLLDAAERAGERLLAEATQRIRMQHPELDVSAELLSGVPTWTLAAHARPDDTLVVGTGKTGYVSGRVLGSRSVQFALAASGTVAVVPEGDPKFRDGVVAGIDRPETAASIARHAAHEAVDRGMRLTLIHAVPPEVAASQRANLESPLVLAAEAARDVAGMLEIRSRLSTRVPAEALLDASRGSALLVVGPGSVGRTHSPLGTTLHAVLLNANAPVLVVRPAAVLAHSAG